MKKVFHYLKQDKDPEILPNRMILHSNTLVRFSLNLTMVTATIVLMLFSTSTIFSQLIINAPLSTTFSGNTANSSPPFIADNAQAMIDMDVSLLAKGKGLLIPRVKLLGTNDITTVIGYPYKNSLLVYNTASVVGNYSVTPGFYYWETQPTVTVAQWVRFSTGSGSTNLNWLLAGNALTGIGNPVLGSTDAFPLNFIVNNKKAGHIDFGAPYNTFFGYQAGNITTGNYNTATGSNALRMTTTGSENTANGDSALYTNTTGNDNTATGINSLHNNTIGFQNTATGALALYSNSKGNNNTAIGNYALLYNTTGNNNTAIGNTANVNSGNLNNATVIGANATATASNEMRLGDANVTTLYCMGATATTTFSPNMYVDNTTGQIMRSTATTGNSAHYLGEQFKCGIIFYLYMVGNTEHGLIVSLDDISTGTVWGTPDNIATSATSPWNGSGNSPGNSYNIQLNTASSAAVQCLGYQPGTCGSGWYLPSMDELNLMYQQSFVINKTLESLSKPLLANNYYWSSTEETATRAIIRGFGTLSQGQGGYQKNGSFHVRAVRAF